MQVDPQFVRGNKRFQVSTRYQVGVGSEERMYSTLVPNVNVDRVWTGSASASQGDSMTMRIPLMSSTCHLARGALLLHVQSTRDDTDHHPTYFDHLILLITLISWAASLGRSVGHGAL